MQPTYYGYPQYMQSQSMMTLDKVANLEEAKKYSMYPGSTVYLLDQDTPYIYLKTCDNTGRTNLRAFSLTEVDVSKLVDNKFITRQDFDDFRKDILAVITNNGGKKNA